jgi:predicted DNA-binding WGR domain protein
VTERQIQLLIPDQRSPIRRAVILRRVDPELRIAQFYSLMIERDLFGTIMLVRSWGRIGTRGSELVQVFATEREAAEALEVLARAKRRRGYRDL